MESKKEADGDLRVILFTEEENRLLTKAMRAGRASLLRAIRKRKRREAEDLKNSTLRF